MLLRENAYCMIGAWLDACALYRMFIPHCNLPGSSFYLFASKPDFSVITGNDTVFVQRCYTQGQFDFIRTVRMLEQKIVYDLDDNVWEIPDYNPAKTILHRCRDGFNACIRHVDMVTVSTDALAKAVRKHVKFMVNAKTGKEIPIIVVENKLDTRMLADPYICDNLIVGWGGSSSHVGDLPIIAPAIESLAKAHPTVNFEFRGIPAPPPLNTYENVRFRPWMPVAEYGMRMPRFGWGISLAPVTDCAFNEAKSAIKMLEAGYCGIPCLASWIRPYEKVCVSHDPELKWLLCAGVTAWETKLRELINEPAKREYYGKRLQQVVLQHYSFNTAHPGWEKVSSTLRAM